MWAPSSPVGWEWARASGSPGRGFWGSLTLASRRERFGSEAVWVSFLSPLNATTWHRQDWSPTFHHLRILIPRIHHLINPVECYFSRTPQSCSLSTRHTPSLPLTPWPTGTHSDLSPRPLLSVPSLFPVLSLHLPVTSS